MDAGYYSSEINIIRDACSLNDICGWYRQGQILWESGNTVETVVGLHRKDMQKSLNQQGFDKDGSRKPVKSRLCRQQADGAFIKNEYEDGKRRILRFASFSYWAFCFTLRNEQTTANAIEWTSIDGVFLLSGKEQKNGNNT